MLSIESLNVKLKDGFINGERMDTMLEVKVLIERWIKQYNLMRAHQFLGYQTTVLQSILLQKQEPVLLS